MTDSMSVLNIKQEIQDTTSNLNNINCFSPSTTTTPTNSSSSNNNNRRNSGSNSGGGTANGMKSSPSVSPERQMCSSTTTLSLNSNGSYNNGEEGANNGSSNAQGSNPSQSSSSGNSIRDELRRLCLVCGDVASGFHYGVASCEACKAFFKRTIQGNIEYTCPANNECEINKRRRKACQACRFQKCLLMGMLKEGVRLDRVRGGRQKYRRNPVSNSYQTMQLLYQSSITSLSDVKILDALSNNEPDLLSVKSVQQNNNGGSSSSSLLEDEIATTNSSPTNVKHEHQHNLLTTNNDNGDISPPSTPTSSTAASTNTASTTTNCIFQLNSSPTNNNNDAHDILGTLSNLYDTELVHVIGWAKSIPGFVELQLSDQMNLLQVTWPEILTLQLIFRSLPFNGKLCFASDLWMDELLAKECGYTEFYYHCLQVAQRLERISVRREEYYLLKALILTNCDINLDDQSSLRAFRDSILNSLNDVVYLLRHSSAVSHQQQLLLLLPALRQADSILRNFWRSVKAKGLVTLKKLFAEMLEPVSR
ncbi:steroid hormone receptor ERR2 [Lucilia sericata]|uniref:steroid hormone receptor ERR2 n=1 Tax=Lucilia sericata TaxID=13632 RepID=UPI0018A837A3|nr:steroid hormone receptor ERR2 [Lucilia sericata]XP_037813182.1 steroid hormone receptor ERR2 [Lucilia sericata]